MTTYKEHYLSCRGSYDFDAPKDRKYDSLYDLTVDGSLLGELDRGLISEIHKKFCYKIDNNIGVFKEAHATRLNEWRDIEEIKTLSNIFMPVMEQQVFNCNAAIEFVHPYRNTVNKTPIKNEWDTESLNSSWKWHYDDCPREFLKFFVYLNEVTENSGCLKYLTDRDGVAPVIESYRVGPDHHAGPQIYQGSRIPPEIVRQKVEEEGWRIKNVVGPAGTYVVHTPNIYHRASCPTPDSEPRDVLFFLLRPKLSKQTAYINSKTKSFSIEGRNINCKRYNLD